MHREMLDAGGIALPGYALGDCYPACGDYADATVKWWRKGGSALGVIDGLRWWFVTAIYFSFGGVLPDE